MSLVEAGGRSRAGLIAAALIALVCALALPAAASAELFEVDSVADEAAVDPAICLTLGGSCTLRAAIQASNSSTTEDDVIVFDETVFEGQLADTIALGSSLPAIVDTVRIEGRQCTRQAGSSGPCQGVSGPGASNPAMTVEGDGVEIEGLAVTGAQTGINIINGAAQVRVKGSWLGVKLDGSAGGNTTGIFIDPESNGDRIGGESVEARNVFAHNSGDGLRIFGADETLVLGNYFGVKPDGITAAANGKNIEVVSQLAGGFVATDNLIGVQAESEAAETDECDRGCNVIAGALGSGVDLQGNSVEGESPAVETHVAGNFIGLGADGTTVVPNAFAGVLVGDAAETTIGALKEDEDEKGRDEANFIAGGSFGIYHENADGFRAMRNQIGFNPSGDEVASPSQVGIFVFCLDTVDPAAIELNEIGMDSGIGIEQRFLGASIFRNFIEGGDTGILATGTGASGNLIERNFIVETAGNGIFVKSDANEVLGNFVFEAGAAGIRIEHAGTPPTASPTTKNRVGGDSEEEENGIFGSSGDAIEIIDFEDTANEVSRNFGAGNGDLFIDLVATNPGETKGPNGGIKPPAFSTSTQSTASGSGAKEGAVIRVFSKGSAEPGELEFFLAEATADAGGNWKVAYPGQIPTGTIVAATQTSKGATSELATATSTVDPAKPKGSTAPGCPAAGPAKCPVTPPLPTARPIPETRISKGPKAKSHNTTATFKFSSTVKGSTFQCKLDKGKFKNCKSPKKYKGLKPGKHVFKVRAVNSAGKADPTPAKRKFQILP